MARGIDNNGGNAATTLPSWVPDYIEMDGEDFDRKDFVALDHDTQSPQNVNDESIPSTDSLLQPMVLAHVNDLDTRPNHDVNIDSTDVSFQGDSLAANDTAVDALVPGELHDPLFPTAWVIPPVLEPGQEMLLDDLPPSRASMSFASQSMDTATSFLSVSQDSFWSSDQDSGLAAAAAAGQPVTPASFDSFATPMESPMQNFTGSDGIDESSSVSFHPLTASTMTQQMSPSSFTAIDMSCDSSSGSFAPSQDLCLTPPTALPMAYGSAHTPAYTVSSPATAESASMPTPAAHGLDDLTLSSSSLVDYSTLSSDTTQAVAISTAQAMQLSHSTQSARSVASDLSFSGQHPLFAPNKLPRVFFGDSPPLEASGSGSFTGPLQSMRGKRTWDDTKAEAGEDAEEPSSKHRRITQDIAPNGYECSASEESFDIGEFVHLPMTNTTAENTSVTSEHPNDQDQTLPVPPQHQPSATSEEVSLGVMVADDPLRGPFAYPAGTASPQDVKYYCATEQQPLIPIFPGSDQSAHADHAQTTVSPRDLHIRETQDAPLYQDEPLGFHSHNDDHHAVQSPVDQVWKQEFHQDHQQFPYASSYRFKSSVSPYSLGETDCLQDRDEPYHYPQPPQTNEQLQASRVSSATDGMFSRVLLPTAAPSPAIVPARELAAEMHTPPPPPALEPPMFPSSSPRNSPPRPATRSQHHYGDHGDGETDARSPVSPLMTSDSERARKDALLLQLRGEGYTYQEIRRRCHFTEAESTMRGRYRVLTKPKEERVRKPQWTAHDDQLLLSAVRSLARGRRVGRDFRVAWKTVADSIVGGGGSYHFGNTTCRKRYDELMAQQRAAGAES
ncbi:hypothetical protein SEPCBS57363_001867 [Sporothrix epigloea]|uniref:Myb-like domain-containing protein n=1 Tax=Sporothrix epigloea TaxID=1892477 RepID=A0ABP0DCN8_9PEZI